MYVDGQEAKYTASISEMATTQHLKHTSVTGTIAFNDYIAIMSSVRQRGGLNLQSRSYPPPSDNVYYVMDILDQGNQNHVTFAASSDETAPLCDFVRHSLIGKIEDNLKKQLWPAQHSNIELKLCPQKAEDLPRSAAVTVAAYETVHLDRPPVSLPGSAHPGHLRGCCSCGPAP